MSFFLSEKNMFCGVMNTMEGRMKPTRGWRRLQMLDDVGDLYERLKRKH